MGVNTGTWKTSQVRDLASYITVGFVGSMSSVFVNTGVPLLRGQNILPYSLDMTNLKYISKETHRKWKKSALQPGDVAIVRVGYPGTACVIPGGLGDLNAASLVIVRPNPELLDSDYLCYVLNSPWGKAQIKGRLVGSAQQVFNTHTAAELEIPAPPLPTQRKIAAILSAYDDLIENNLRRIKILEEMAQNLYREWFVKFRFPGHQHARFTDSALGPIPEGWEVKNLLSVADVTYGFAFQSKRFNSDGNGLPVVRIRDVLAGTSDTFSPEEAGKKYLVENGDILVGMDGDFHMGFWVGGQAYLVQRVARFRSKGEIGRYHLFLSLQEPIQYFDATITGTTVAHLGDKHIKTIEIKWPQTQLINQINNILEPMLAQILNLRIKNTTLRRTRDLLLPRLISGEVDVSELDIVVPEEAAA